MVTWVLDVETLPEEPVRETSGPDHELTQKLFAYARGVAGARGARDVALLHLLYDVALRESEVCTLQMQHFDGRRIHIKGKGRRERAWVTLPEPTIMALQAWLGYYRAAGTVGPTSPLLSSFTRYGEVSFTPLYGQYVWRTVKSLGERALGRKLWPHALRHSAITRALDLDHNPRAVQRFSRHASIDMVMRYDDNRQDLGGEIASAVAASVHESAPVYVVRKDDGTEAARTSDKKQAHEIARACGGKVFRRRT